MSRVVYYHKNFKVLKVGFTDYVVVRKHQSSYSQHSHLKSLHGAINLIKLIDSGRLPESDYLKESARRILRDKEFYSLKPAQGFY
ncbi:MAG: hypothetical protein K0M69_09645 [Youngiibacter sp.]|jgi:hypothetical protein|nr:hypothetical protein [Youngiibacter sp.]